MGVHDRLFKELLSTFLYEFLELFLPDLAASLDRDSIEFLDKEMFTELAEGERREADLVVKARFKGEEVFFIIHLEHQAQSKDIEEFPFRMFTYYSVLVQRYRVRVYPIALLSYSSPRKAAPSSYSITFPDFEPLHFKFRTIQLNQLQWRDFMRRENPVAAALMSRMNIKKKDRPTVKAACLRLLGKQNLDKARSMLVSHFIAHYLQLDPIEEMRFHEEVDSLPLEETEIVMDLMNSWEKEGLEKGQIKALRLFLEARFGAIPTALLNKLEGLSSDRLEPLLSLAATVESLEDFQSRL